MFRHLRILHVVETLERGGLERVVVDLALQQQRSGHRPTVFCLFHQGPLALELRAADIEVISGNKRKGLDIRALARLRHAAVHKGQDVVHSHNPTCNYYAAAALLLATSGLRLVNTRHNMGALDPKDARERLFRLSLKRTARVVMVSRTVYTRFVEAGIVQAAKARVQINGLPSARYLARTTATAERARLLLRVDPATPLVGAVGRLDPVKNHRSLLEACARLISRWPTLRIVIIGSGPLHDDLKTYARMLGLNKALMLMGERDDVAQLLPALDVFAMPSLSEGHSIALLEACASALPIIATAVGGNPEIIVDGQTGLLTPSNDPRALGDGIARLVQEREFAAYLGRQAREWLIESASIDAMSEGYESIYRELLRLPE